MTEGNLVVCIENALPPVVRASGELDQVSCPAFESVLQRAFDGGHGTVLLDLEELDFIDSCGIRVLIRAATDAEKAGRSLQIASMTPHLDHVLTLSGFRDLFGITADIAPIRAEVKTPTGEDLCISVSRVPDVCRQVRDEVAEFAEQMGFGSLAIDDIRLAVGEATSNAVRHGAVCDDSIEVRCRNLNGKLRVTFRYPSAQFDPDAVPPPTYATAPEGGMGIYFMRLVMDLVEYQFEGGYTQLTIEKKLPELGGPNDFRDHI